MGSPDEINCRWCKANGAVLITHDRGKTNREILGLLDQNQVSAILVLKDLRRLPPRYLALAVLCAETKMDALIDGRHCIRHQLRRSGHLVKP